MSVCCPTKKTQEPVETRGGSVRGSEWFKVGLAALVASQVMIFSLAVSLSPPTGRARLIIHGVLAVSTLMVFLLLGLPLVRESWRHLRGGRIVFEQLFLVGIAGAFFASLQATLTGAGSVYYEVVAILVGIYTLGRMIAESRQRATLDSAQALRREFDACIRLTCCGQEERVPVRDIVPGDRIRVVPGEGIPVDGDILTGVAFLRETPLTGEPFPVVKRAGDPVWAGSQCLDEALEIRATVPGTLRKLDRLLASLESARRNPAHLEREADRIVGWFLPAVLAIAVVTFAGWTWAEHWQRGLLYGLSVLLVACPCAMGLATPIGLWSALSALARRGLVAASGDFIERLGRVDAVVFDKTGTLSEESMRVVDFVCAGTLSRSTLKSLIAAVQSRSHHPVARALTFDTAFQGPDAAGKGGQDFEVLKPLTLLSGVGVAAEVAASDGTRYQVQIGNSGLLGTDDEPQTLRQQLRVTDTASHEIFIKVGGRLEGLATLREAFRQSTPRVLGRFRQAGLQVFVMTGDREQNARALNIPGVMAGLTPEQKGEEVRKLQAAGHRVLFVGDGINDTLALSAAHAGIAMGGGAGLARESAQAVLYGEDLETVSQAVFLSRRVLAAIHNNMLFAVFYNCLGILLAASGHLHPVAAAVLMLGSSVLVSWRAFRLGEKITAPEGPVVDLQKTRSLGEKWHQWRDTLRTWDRATLFFAVAFALQGPFLAYLAGLEAPGYGWLTLVSLTLALVIPGVLVHQPRAYAARMCFGMLSVGTLAMLAGWWMDAGFGAVIREGVCLCGCSKSAMGWGVVSRINFMQVGMMAGGLWAMMLVADTLPVALREGPRRLAHLLTCGLGMLAGMELGALLMTPFPVMNPQGYFFLSFGAMTGGMILGMLLTCFLWVRLTHGSRVSGAWIGPGFGKNEIGYGS
ncbi:MAG: cation-translocating P-type ATPase [Verrucomicrobiae bacterium]|nr:cation-translocating P-type ATPase [Verrucomicrobiae bacterium]